jgi:gamma-glutamyltranspeptidase/glutathione hydrolase
MRSPNPTPELWSPPESMRPTVVGGRSVVSAGHPLVADVAMRVFAAGGNAIDAGVAGGLAANVVQSDMCNFGGVAPVLVRGAGDDTVHSVAGLGTWGTGATAEAHVARHGGDMPAGGPCAVVPAAPAAWIAALKRFGTWSFADVAAPAIELALEGFALDLRLAESLQITGGTFGAWPSTRQVYWPEGRAPREGEWLVQEDLGRLLQRLADAERGATRADALDRVHREFYESEVADVLVRWVTEGGGWMTREDLAGFQAEIEPAVCASYRGWDVYVTDTWTQGPALLQALNILGGFDLSALGHNSADYLHTLAEAVKLAFADRERFYGDPRHVDVPLDWLLSQDRATELRDQIRPDRVLPTPIAAGSGSARADTTYLCTADAAGNAFSATVSDTIDGAPIVPGLGIMVSPRGVQSRLDPAHPAGIAPGKRPRLTPAPGLATRREAGADDLMVWPFGCPGGDVILQAMLQTLVNSIDFGMTPQQAVEAPRASCFSFPGSFFPHAHVSGRISIEDRIEQSVRTELGRRGHEIVTWPGWEFDAGGVCHVRDIVPPHDGRRALGAGADPRRICYAQGR